MAGQPDGLCACGCGQQTPIADRNRYARGILKGQPTKYVPGHGSQNAPLVERFWRYVDKSDDGCWIWTGSRDQRGYGKLNRGRTGEGNVKAHRLSYEIHKGDPGDLFVCHSCDNPSCVNPDHLFAGTHDDNMADASRKKRMSGRPLVVDPDELVAYVRAGHSYRETSDHFGVPTSTVWRYLKRANALIRSS